MKIAFLFGGSGYIAKFLLQKLIEVNRFDKYYVFDIKKLEGFDKDLKEQKIMFDHVDVRNPIKTLDLDLDTENSWIFNFAAIHREPGHEQPEYFDTNINGAKNVNAFAESMGIENILFTSSIAPYGRSLHERTEQSELYPETPYGISKGMAELIHKNWCVQGNKKRRLIVVRPSVIYGPGDPGNVYRMIKALKKGTFVIPGDGTVVKAYGYVYGLIESMLFVMNRDEKIITYNYAENPIVNLKEMTKIAKEELGYKKPTLQISVKLLAFIAFFVQKAFKIIGKKSDIHPVRVRKAGFPTNIKPEFLIENGFEFKYGFKTSLQHWKKISPSDFK
ncbi:NAD(P)-dependent oxidoreductase [Aquimarina sp. D1M17]|uniref:NAD-dependent epimerase/dehydratase family protein n=1 Tax=Aquimarina acroporae TaxID=2937283 RepID=UPI0020C1540B|nr:NAD(P)-dependent oxidoreductase [Aquimarina acroporae]MCK8523320.1 NAD(P)-dependent oxidoreductase [Aquimarina acroporae]